MTRTRGDIPVETERRPDGWPLCPDCGEDELADLQHWDARPFGHLFCYRCCRFYEIAPARSPKDDPPPDAPLTGDELEAAVIRLRGKLARR